MKLALITWKLMLIGLVLMGFGASVTRAKMQYTKKEKTACTTCHVKAGAKELNDVGKCYAKKQSLEECRVPENKE